MPATMVNTGRLGVPSKVLTFLGDDFFSEYARTQLERNGADVVNLYDGNGMPVVLSSTMVCNGDRSFLSYRDEVKITDNMCEEIYKHLCGARVVAMHIGFAEVYKKLKSEGTIQVFDMGWDDDMSIEKYREYLETADYYLPNQKEALKITGASTLEEAADRLGQYFEDVIIKLDKDGCMLKNKHGTKIIEPLEIVGCVDSTGAGDAFMSGFIYGLYHKYPIEQCIRFGNITGGKCVERVGCLAGYVNEQQLLELGE